MSYCNANDPELIALKYCFPMICLMNKICSNCPLYDIYSFRQSLVPGPNVGYMPQELALYGEFTIKETLQYFGRCITFLLSFFFCSSWFSFLFYPVIYLAYDAFKCFFYSSRYSIKVLHILY